MKHLKRPLNLLIAEDSKDETRLVQRQFERAGCAVTHERVETAAGFQAGRVRARTAAG